MSAAIKVYSKAIFDAIFFNGHNVQAVVELAALNSVTTIYEHSTSTCWTLDRDRSYLKPHSACSELTIYFTKMKGTLYAHSDSIRVYRGQYILFRDGEVNSLDKELFEKLFGEVPANDLKCYKRNL